MLVKLNKIHLNQFTKTYIAKNNQKRSRNTKHENGIFGIKISDANLHRKIIGWVHKFKHILDSDVN